MYKRDNHKILVFISLSLLFFLFSISFTFAKVGYNIEQGVNIDTSTITNYFNGSNINISTTTCSGTDKVISINNATGTISCGSDLGSDTFVANYSDFLNVKGLATNGTFLLKSSWNSTNTSYNIGYLLTTNNTFLQISNWNATNSSYALFSQLNNGSYLNPDLTSYITQSILNNGTYLINSILNNGSYFNVAGGDSFVGNYSRFLIIDALATNNTFYDSDNPSNYINWATATNGTLALMSNLSSYLLISNWNSTNTTYNLAYLLSTNNTFYDADNPSGYISSYTETDPKWLANYTNILTSCPAGNYTYGIFVNGTLKCSTDVSGAGAETDPFWSANYSVFLTHTTTSYVDTQNTSQTNYMEFLNTSNNNYIFANNQSVNNYILFVNSTNGVGGSTGNYTILSYWANITDRPTTLSFFTNNLNIGNWTADKGSYTLLSILNNGTYTNQFTGINWTNHLIAYNMATNNTFTLLSILNNGSYFNPASSDSFVGNYSRFLIIDALATNNTFAQLTGANFTGLVNTTGDMFIYKTLNLTASYYLTTNNTFAQLTTLNNGSYLNIAETDPLWSANFTNLMANCGGTDKAIGIFSNGTIECSADLQGSGVADVWVNETGEDWNTSRNIVPQLNNTYDLGNTTSRYKTIFAIALDFYTQITTSQIANSAISAIKLATESVTAIKIALGVVNTTHILDNTILDDDIASGQINTTHILDNTITGIDTSANFNTTYDTRYTTTSYVDTQNTSQTNYINFQNTSVTNALATKRDTINFTFTQTVNITGASANSNLSLQQGSFICLNYQCSQWIKANSTGVFIQG